MRRVIGLRLLELIPVLLLVTFASYFLVDLLPGDPAVAILGPNRPAADYERMRDRLDLDAPVIERYGEWLTNALQGDLGETVVPPRTSVSSRIEAALPVSLELAALGLIIALAVSIPVAMASAAKPDGRFDRIVTACTFGLVSIPSFLAGILLILLFVKIWPIAPRAQWIRLTDGGLVSNLEHAWLPATAIALSEIPVFVRVLRGDLIQTLQQDFILAARARGVPSWRILSFEALRISSFSLVTLAGVSLGRTIGSTVVVEALFGLPGLGSVSVTAATNRDITLLQGAIVTIAVVYVLVNALVDTSYAWIDPRIRRARA
jgi:peptide/nickel transport system permease protein